MEIIIGLIAVSLGIAVIFLVVFLWNLKSGQYDDTYSPSVRMLFEDKMEPNHKKVVHGNNRNAIKPSQKV